MVGERAVADWFVIQSGLWLRWASRIPAGTEDAVHQLRVTSRRLRAGLTLWPECGPPDAGSADQLRSDLRWVARTLGAARDLEVIIAALAEAAWRDGGQRDREQFLDWLGRRGAEQLLVAERRVAEAMDTERWLRVASEVESLGRDAARWPDLACSAALPPVRQRAEQVVTGWLRATEAGDHDSLDDQRHRVRRLAKGVRYTAEALAEHDAGAATFAALAHQIADQLGRAQDSVVQSAFLQAAPRCETTARLAGLQHQLRADQILIVDGTVGRLESVLARG